MSGFSPTTYGALLAAFVAGTSSSLAGASSLFIDAQQTEFTTAHCQVAGDGGGAQFVRIAAQQTVPASPALDYRGFTCFRSQDRYAPDGSYDPTNGGWWGLVKQFDVDSRRFGAKWDGVTGDSTALQMAVDYLGTRGVTIDRRGTVYAGGTPLLTSTLVVRYGLIGLRGDGIRSTEWQANGDIGDIVLVANINASSKIVSQVSGFSIRDLTIRQYFAATTNGACLHLVRVVEAAGSNVRLSNHFGGLFVEGGAIQTFTNLVIRSGGLWAGPVTGSYMVKTRPGTTATGPNSGGLPLWNGGTVPNEIYFTGFSWDGDFTSGSTTRIGNIERGLDYGTGDGVFLSNGHIYGCFVANVYISPTLVTTQCDGLRCDQVWFDNNSANGIILTGTVTNPAATPFGDFQFNDCKWLGGLYNGYFFWWQTGCNAKKVSISGHMDKAGLSAIRLEGAGSDVTIDPHIGNSGQQGLSEAYAIYIAGSMSGITIKPGLFGDNFNSATATQKGSVYVAGGTPDNIAVGTSTHIGGQFSVLDVTATQHKTYADQTEPDTFWQGVVASGTVLQLPAAGSYFELDPSVTTISDMTGKWLKRTVRIKAPAGGLTLQNSTGVFQTNSGGTVNVPAGMIASFVQTSSGWQQL